MSSFGGGDGSILTFPFEKFKEIEERKYESNSNLNGHNNNNLT